MTTPSINASLSYPRALGLALRLVLVALAVAVLGVIAFVAEQATSGSTTPSSPSHVQAPASVTGSGSWCQVGRLRGPC